MKKSNPIQSMYQNALKVGAGIALIAMSAGLEGCLQFHDLNTKSTPDKGESYCPAPDPSRGYGGLTSRKGSKCRQWQEQWLHDHDQYGHGKW